MKASDLKVCVVIPAFNEGAVIGNVVRDAKKSLQRIPFHSDVLVVDDDSRDNTASEARNAGAIVISHILNSGAGGATATGLSFASQNGYEIAATMDADGQHNSKDVVTGIELMSQSDYDLLIGSRLINSDGMSRVKVLGNKGLSFITFILFGINVTDSQSGLRIFSKNALKQLRWKTSGYEFCSEMLWRARQLNMSIKEYPIEAIYTEYSKGKGQSNWNAINIIKTLLRRRIVEMFE